MALAYNLHKEKLQSKVIKEKNRESVLNFAIENFPHSLCPIQLFLHPVWSDTFLSSPHDVHQLPFPAGVSHDTPIESSIGPHHLAISDVFSHVCCDYFSSQPFFFIHSYTWERVNKKKTESKSTNEFSNSLQRLRRRHRLTLSVFSLSGFFARLTFTFSITFFQHTQLHKDFWVGSFVILVWSRVISVKIALISSKNLSFE